jgi:hypothetical protein
MLVLLENQIIFQLLPSWFKVRRNKINEISQGISFYLSENRIIMRKVLGLITQLSEETDTLAVAEFLFI